MRVEKNGDRVAPDFRALFGAMPAPCLAVIPAELTVVAVNAAFLRAASLSEEAVLGRHLDEVFADARLDAGAWNATHTPVLDVDGDVTLILHALEDVTAVTRAQQQLRAMERVVAETTAARNEAQRTSQLKTRFLGMVSHELRTPLTALCLQVERMQRSGACLEQRQKEALERIAFSATRLREMIETLLEYARIEGGHVVVNASRFDLGESVQQVVELHRITAEHRGLDLDCSAQPPTLVNSDRRLVELVISNLVDNAIKFTTAGHVAVALGRSAEGAHQVAVSDSGPGIPEAQQDRIFEPFEQLDASLPRHKPIGIGLGLALVRDIAGALGGRIELVSRPREGSTFTFVLPVPRDETRAPPSPALGER